MAVLMCEARLQRVAAVVRIVISAMGEVTEVSEAHAQRRKYTLMDEVLTIAKDRRRQDGCSSLHNGSFPVVLLCELTGGGDHQWKEDTHCAKCL